VGYNSVADNTGLTVEVTSTQYSVPGMFRYSKRRCSGCCCYPS